MTPITALSLASALFSILVLVLAPLFTFIGTEHVSLVRWAAAALLLAILLFTTLLPPGRPPRWRS